MSDYFTDQPTSLFETLADSAPDAIFTIDEGSMIVFANAATERVFGHSPQELIGQPLAALIPERFRAQHTHGVARYLRTGKRNIPWTGVALPGLRKDGSEVALEISFGEFIDEQGRRLFSGFVRDISERQRAREELEAARATAQRALDELAAVGRVMNLALASGTYEGMIQQLLQGMRNELRVDEATVLLLDSRANALVVQETQGITLDRSVTIPVGEGLAGAVAVAGTSLVVDDVSAVHVVHDALRREIKSLAAVPLRVDGALIGVLHVGTRAHRKFSTSDVRLLEIIGERMAGVLARTRLFQQERAARDAEHRLRTVAQAMSQTDQMDDVMRQLAEAASGMSHAVGVFVERALEPGETHEVEVVAAVGRGTPGVGQRVPFPGSLTQEIIAGRRAVFLPDLAGFGRAMAPFVESQCEGCGVLLVPLFARDRVLGALALVRERDTGPFEDSTIDRIRALADIASIAMHRLLSLQESERRRVEAETAARLRDEVLSIVSHDLRNPVSTVAMSAALLSDADIRLDDDQRAAQIQVIRRSAERMNRLIEDLLDVAKIEHGRFAIEARSDDPAEIVSEAVESFRPLIEGAGVSLSADASPPLPRVCADRDRVLQALSNLISNALKFTPPGGTITARVRPDGNRVRFEVQDTGSGIADADLPHVFDRFWQAKRTAHMGSGLGLAIVKGIAQAHEGDVFVQSELGKGSTFAFDIPAIL